MIETDQQRRWWFATHPEFSSSRRGERSKHYGEEDDDSGGPSPEFVDKQIDELLKHEKDDFFIDLLRDVKFWFGTESASMSAAEKDALLGDDDSPTADYKPTDAFGEDWWSQQPFIHPAAGRNTYDKYEDALDAVDAYNHELWLQAIEEDKKGLVPDPHTFLDVAPLGRFITSPIQALRSVLRSMAENAVVSAVKKGKAAGGPGEWVEVARSRIGLEHQSKMSGQRIRESGGKHYIGEYKILTENRPVYFDDFRDGLLYEYKGTYGKLLNKDKVFYHWFKGATAARDQAWRQVRAAQGVPVIWRVGADQVKAFNRALGDIPGVSIVP